MFLKRGKFWWRRGKEVGKIENEDQKSSSGYFRCWCSSIIIIIIGNNSSISGGSSNDNSFHSDLLSLLGSFLTLETKTTTTTVGQAAIRIQLLSFLPNYFSCHHFNCRQSRPKATTGEQDNDSGSIWNKKLPSLCILFLLWRSFQLFESSQTKEEDNFLLLIFRPT